MALQMTLQADAALQTDAPQEDSQKALMAPRPRGRARRASLAGCIMWLPSKAEIGSAFDIDDGCYNHPVVVLSPQARRGKVSLLVLTPLNGKNVEDRHPHNLWARLVYLPIQPCEPHPDNGLLLRLHNSSNPLRQPCYVATDKQFRVTLTALRSYDRPDLDYRLNIASYRTLVDYIQFHDGDIASPSLLAEVETKPDWFPPHSPDSDLQSRQPLLQGAGSVRQESTEITIWSPYRTFTPQSGIVDESSCSQQTNTQQLETTVQNGQLTRDVELPISLIEEGYQSSGLGQTSAPEDSWTLTRTKSREHGVVIKFARERRVLKKSPSILTIVLCFPCLLLLAISLLFVELAVYWLG